jgi:hypothetical protein
MSIPLEVIKLYIGRGVRCTIYIVLSLGFQESEYFFTHGCLSVPEYVLQFLGDLATDDDPSWATDDRATMKQRDRCKGRKESLWKETDTLESWAHQRGRTQTFRRKLYIGRGLRCAIYIILSLGFQASEYFCLPMSV